MSDQYYDYGLKEIGDYTFDGCESLVDFRLPSDVRTIGKYAFRNCAITEVGFAVWVESVDDYAFYNCTSLVYIHKKYITVFQNIFSLFVI